MFLSPPPVHNNDFGSHMWQSWFGFIFKILDKVEHIDGHWYVTNGNTHAVSTSAGVKTSTTTVVNTVTSTLLYSYTLLADEVHKDEQIILSLLGSIDAATAAETVTIEFKVAGVTQKTLVITPKNITNSGWKAEYSMTVRSSGASGTFVDFATFKTDIASISSAAVTTTTINTDTSNLVEVYATWGAAKAGNSISCVQGGLVFHH